MAKPTPTPSFTIPTLTTLPLLVGANQQDHGKSKATRKTSVDLTLDNGKHVRLRDTSILRFMPQKCHLSRLSGIEPALLAFVQHFDFIWEDGWILLGRKSADEGSAHVWCKVVKLPVQTKLRFAQDADRVPFTGSRNNVLEYHASFIGLLGECQMSNDRPTFMMGIYWILELFPSMRRSFDPTRTMILPPSQPAELPFLPNSAWIRDGTVRPAEDATGDANSSEALEEKEGQSLDNAGAGPFTPKKSKQVGGSASCQASSSIHRSSHKRRASGSAEGTPTKKSQVKNCSR
ncbi:MAG: Uncharacterized protein AUREO_035740 [Aureobasidium pullulans]|nr:MAG: Uncharacterized protein AUREO_035740 [Aureobasidium pullulans]